MCLLCFLKTVYLCVSLYTCFFFFFTSSNTISYTTTSPQQRQRLGRRCRRFRSRTRTFPVAFVPESGTNDLGRHTWQRSTFLVSLLYLSNLCGFKATLVTFLLCALDILFPIHLINFLMFLYYNIKFFWKFFLLLNIV